MGLLPDLIDLEAPLSELERVVEAVRLEQNARELTRNERRGSVNRPRFFAASMRVAALW